MVSGSVSRDDRAVFFLAAIRHGSNNSRVGERVSGSLEKPDTRGFYGFPALLRSHVRRNYRVAVHITVVRHDVSVRVLVHFKPFDKRIVEYLPIPAEVGVHRLLLEIRYSGGDALSERVALIGELVADADSIGIKTDIPVAGVGADKRVDLLYRPVFGFNLAVILG